MSLERRELECENVSPPRGQLNEAKRHPSSNIHTGFADTSVLNAVKNRVSTLHFHTQQVPGFFSEIWLRARGVATQLLGVSLHREGVFFLNLRTLR